SISPLSLHDALPISVVTVGVKGDELVDREMRTLSRLLEIGSLVGGRDLDGPERRGRCRCGRLDKSARLAFRQPRIERERVVAERSEEHTSELQSRFE